MAVLVLLIGVPGSGKSTVATRFHSLGYPVISTDQIRAQLFGDPAVQGAWPLIWQQVEQQFQQAAQSELALYDATNARRRGRREVIRLARQTGFGRVCGLWLNPPLDLCLERNCQRSRQVPEAVIRRMYQQIRTSPPMLRHRQPQKFGFQYGNRATRSVRTEPRIRQFLVALRVGYINFLEELG
ncbi:MAG: AAA family ATPase [Elainella sp.]